MSNRTHRRLPCPTPALVALLLFAACGCARLQAGTTISFQGRLHDLTAVPLAPDVGVVNASDLIFVKTTDGKKYLCLPATNGIRGDFDSATQRFYLLNGINGNVGAFSKIDGLLINLDGTFFSQTFFDPPLTSSPLEEFSRPITIPSTEIATDICILDDLRIGYRTDGSTLNPDNSPRNDEKIYVIRRQASSVIEEPTVPLTLRDADLPNSHRSVFLEYDTENQSFLVLQNQLNPNRNTDLRDRLEAYLRDATLNGRVFLTKDNFDTPDDFFPGYSGNTGGVAVDPETSTVYILDPGSRQLFVLTPRRTQILTVSPNTGGAPGGTEVVLTGINFPSDAAVFFDGVAATNVKAESLTRITCTTPAHALGSVDVSLTGTGITAARPVVAAGAFTYVNVPPTLVFAASPTRGAAPLTVFFDLAGTLDPDGTLAERKIDFGDGTPPFTFTDPNVTTVSHTYLADGSYLAAATVTDNLGGQAKASKVILVGEESGLIVTGVSARASQPVTGKAVRDTLSIKGQFVLPDDIDLSAADVSIGLLRPGESALEVFAGGEDAVFKDIKFGGQLDFSLDDNARFRTRPAGFSFKPLKKKGFLPSTQSFTVTARGFALLTALETAVVNLKTASNGTPLTEAELTEKRVGTVAVVLRFQAGADVLQFRKLVVVGIAPQKSGGVTLKRN